MDSANNRLKTLFSIHGWESVEAEGQMYALFYVILHKGLEHPQILLSVGVFLEKIPDTIYNFWGS